MFNLGRTHQYRQLKTSQMNVRIKAGKNFHKIVLFSHGICRGALGMDILYLPIAALCCVSSKSCSMAFIKLLTTQKHLVNEEREEKFRYCVSKF